MNDQQLSSNKVHDIKTCLTGKQKRHAWDISFTCVMGKCSDLVWLQAKILSTKYLSLKWQFSSCKVAVPQPAINVKGTNKIGDVLLHPTSKCNSRHSSSYLGHFRQQSIMEFTLGKELNRTLILCLVSRPTLYEPFTSLVVVNECFLLGVRKVWKHS